MWKLLKRIFAIFIAKGNKAVDAIEDKVELLEQKVRELKDTLDASVKGLAKVKALEIKLASDQKALEAKADKFLEDAKKLKAKVKNEEYENEDAKAELEGYIVTMLNKYENMKNEAAAKVNEVEKQKQICSNLEKKIGDLKTLITKTEGNVVNLKAQKQAAETNKAVSQELSSLNVDGVSGQIDEIERAIQQDNSEAEAWVQLDENLETDEDKIEKLLNQSSPTADSKLLEDFMKD
jgi:phage shock protein A